jgi:hypothetical protein
LDLTQDRWHLYGWGEGRFGLVPPFHERNGLGADLTNVNARQVVGAAEGGLLVFGLKNSVRVDCFRVGALAQAVLARCFHGVGRFFTVRTQAPKSGL